MSNLLAYDTLKKKEKCHLNKRQYGRASALATRTTIAVDEKFKNKQLRFYSSKSWAQMRERVMRKAGHQCQACRKFGGALHVDHIQKISPATWHMRLQESNLQVLCDDCHGKKTNLETMPSVVENADFIFKCFT